MSNSPCSPGQQPPQSEPQCITYDDKQFCFGGDGKVTFKTNTTIIDPTTVGVCNEYTCEPITQLSHYSTQMNMQIFNKYIHDNVCPVPGIDVFIQERLKGINNNPPPTSWDEASKVWGGVFEYRLLNTIKDRCNDWNIKYN
jgi:hypothetical protein